MIVFCNYYLTVGAKGQGVLAGIFTDLRPAETCLNSHVTDKKTEEKEEI